MSSLLYGAEYGVCGSRGSGPNVGDERALPERIPVLLQTYWFADLTPAEIAPFAEDAVMRRYARGEYADHIGAPATHLLVVLHGHSRRPRATRSSQSSTAQDPKGFSANRRCSCRHALAW
ncbi:MAG: hypothetical protein NVSMB55_01280 [Mycobacteriales bacterium]